MSAVRQPCSRTCQDCRQLFPLNGEYFERYPSGKYRIACRGCTAKKRKHRGQDAVERKATDSGLVRLVQSARWA